MKDLKKQEINTLLAFGIFAVLVFVLYLVNRNTWRKEEERLTMQQDSLQQKIRELEKRYISLEQAVFEGDKFIYNHYFDSFDSNRFRVYGLLRDDKKRYTLQEVAEKFNVFTPSAIKENEVMGERWFVVPVKGLHFYAPGETIAALGSRYYEHPQDSVLIKAFNPGLSHGKFIFIPFGRQ